MPHATTIDAFGKPVFAAPYKWAMTADPLLEQKGGLCGQTYTFIAPDASARAARVSTSAHREARGNRNVTRHGIAAAGKRALPEARWRRFHNCQVHRSAYKGADGQLHQHPSVNVMYLEEQQRAYFAGLQTCGSPWVCAVCSAAIYDHRRTEIAHTLDWARATGKPVHMLTFTVSHKRDTPLETLQAGLASAMRDVFTGRPFQDFKKAVGYLGAIKATEITHGANGWHMHFHALWISESGTTASLTAYAGAAWRAALKRVGFHASVAHGLNVKESSMTGEDYLAKFEHQRKWDLDAELTMWQRKEGTAGMSPWDLLRDGSPSSVELFREYAVAMFGKSSIRFSPGLKSLVGLDDVTDDQAAAFETGGDRGELWVQLYPEDWKIVMGNDCRGELLLVAGRGDKDALDAFLKSIGVMARCLRQSVPLLE